VRGRGLMIGIEMADGAQVQATRAAASEAGLLTLACGATGQVLRLIPPLVVTAEEVDEGLARLETALDKALT